MTWIGNLFFLASMISLGYKKRHAFLLGAAGDVLWLTASVRDERWDLASICAVFVTVAIRNYFKWGNDE